MLFSLIGFEIQTCTIICESICNIIFRCNPVYVMCICLIPRSWLWCWFTEVFRDTRRTTGFIWVKVCACQRVSRDSRTWSCINWAVLLHWLIQTALRWTHTVRSGSQMRSLVLWQNRPIYTRSSTTVPANMLTHANFHLYNLVVRQVSRRTSVN